MAPSKKSDKKMPKEIKSKIKRDQYNKWTGSGGLSGGGIYKSLDKLNKTVQGEMQDKHRKMMDERIHDKHRKMMDERIRDQHNKIMNERMHDQHNKMMNERVQDQHNKMMDERMQDRHNKMMMQNHLMRRRPTRTGTTPSKAGERRIRQ